MIEKTTQLFGVIEIADIAYDRLSFIGSAAFSWIMA